NSADKAQILASTFHHDLAAADGTLECFPCERLTQEFQRVNEQIATICPVKRAGLDEHEIGNERTHLRHMLDATKQVRHCRMVFIDDGRAAADIAACIRNILRATTCRTRGAAFTAIVHDNIDLVTAKGISAGSSATAPL